MLTYSIQYPKVVTAITCPREDCVYIDADYSQIEYRVLVAMAKEDFLMKMFFDPDTDYHTLQASNMYGVDYAAVTKQMRGDAKSFNFGIPYGMGFRSLAILLFGQTEEWHIEEAKRKYELYFKDQPRVRQFFDDVKEMALVNKYTKTYFGRRRSYSFTDKDGKENNAAKAQALRQAGNAVIQGTAADIFKIAAARLFLYIKENDLFDKLYMTNMVHDEHLMEVNVQKLNPKAAIRDIGRLMQFKQPGFPPLYIGAGFGMNWAYAKGPIAEIHPNLYKEICESVGERSIYDTTPMTPEECVDMMNAINLEFRTRKVRTYLENPDNHGRHIHPVIGSLIAGHFAYDMIKPGEKGYNEKAEQVILHYIEKLGLEIEDIEKISDDDFAKLLLAQFIDVNKLDVSINDFEIKAEEKEAEEDDEYSDDEEEDIEDMVDVIGGNDFALIDEDAKLYGIPLEEVIATFGLVVSLEKHIVGIDARNLTFGERDKIATYLEEHMYDEETMKDEELDVCQVVLLGTNNKLTYVPFYVHSVTGSELSKIVKMNSKYAKLI